MAEAAKALGTPQSFAFRGKTYRLAPFTFDRAAEFELWLEGRAWDSVERVRHLCTEEEYQRRLDAVARLVATGHFAFGSSAASEAARTLPGMKQCLLLQLRACAENGPVTERLVEDVFAEMRDRVLALLKEGEGDPFAGKSQAGETLCESPTSAPSSPASPGA